MKDAREGFREESKARWKEAVRQWNELWKQVQGDCQTPFLQLQPKRRKKN